MKCVIAFVVNLLQITPHNKQMRVMRVFQSKKSMEGLETQPITGSVLHSMKLTFHFLFVSWQKIVSESSTISIFVRKLITLRVNLLHLSEFERCALGAELLCNSLGRCDAALQVSSTPCRWRKYGLKPEDTHIYKLTLLISQKRKRRPPAAHQKIWSYTQVTLFKFTNTPKKNFFFKRTSPHFPIWNHKILFFRANGLQLHQTDCRR